jgi:hypothetical protein
MNKREKDKKSKEMNSKTLLRGIEGNVGNEMNCNDRIRNDEVANILLLLNRKNTLDNSCNDKEDNNGEGENEGDINYQFEANVKMSARELGKGNVSVAEECGVDNCEGEFHINHHKCNVITDTEDDIGLIFQLEGNDEKVSLREL